MNKRLLLIIGGIAALFFVLRGKGANGGGSVQGYTLADDPTYNNSTLYIPTNSYEIKVNEGTITNNVNNSSNDNIVGSGTTITTPPPILSGVMEDKTPTLTTPPATTTPTPAPKPTTPTPTPKPTYKTYTVKKGDTLWKLSGGTNAKLQALLKINPQITNPNLIKVGQVIKIPL